MTLSPKEILLTFVQGVEGKFWATERNGWSESSDVPICDWNGIACNDDSTQVVQIDLGASNFLGTIPTEIGLLSSLTSLNVRKNIVWGQLPTEVTALPRLSVLLLDGNKLTGSVPHLRSPSIVQLDLGFNEFQGSLPLNFGENSTELKVLELRHNRLTGTTPLTISTKMTNLEVLSFSGNSISGILPSLENMNQLERIYFDDNKFVGPIPNVWGNKLENLEEVWLDNNMLSGTIPESLAQLANLDDIYVNGNKLTGTVPKVVCEAQFNEDFFSDQRRSGSDVDEDQKDYCDSVACPKGETAMDESFPCFQCPTTASNPYIGRVGSCVDLSEDRVIIKMIRSIQGGHGGDPAMGHESNGSSSTISACDFNGVSCNSQGKVMRIDFSNKGLTGTIPDELGFFEALQELDLSDNDLTGHLPSGLRFSPLKKMDISGNKIRGIVPPLLCQKKDLNENGKNGRALRCDVIACPVGTFSKSGHKNCESCDGGAPYLASKSCSPIIKEGSLDDSSSDSGGRHILIIILVCAILVWVLAMLAVCSLCGLKSCLRPRKRPRNELDDEENGEEKEFIVNEEAETSLPHPEEQKTRGSSSLPLTNWARRTIESIRSSYSGNDVKPGEIDDEGWSNRRSMTLEEEEYDETAEMHRIVETQKSEDSVGVWEYPDPLETELYTEDNTPGDGLFENCDRSWASTEKEDFLDVAMT
mmetsp:Transcript_16618/g.23101  ORF Transcript_16618/g.23101 Transcript_16618/m.23101 type:complete len:700 (-) Transcript_16618:251-2350(-)